MVSLVIVGSAEPVYRGRRRWESSEEDEYTEGEEIDRTLTLTCWRHPEDIHEGLGDLKFSEDEFASDISIESLEPDEDLFMEASGNEGATYERSYRVAALVLWPRDHEVTILKEMGLGALVNRFARVVSEKNHAEAEFFAEILVKDWPRRGVSGIYFGPSYGLLLETMAQHGNRQFIETLLRELVAQGVFQKADISGIVAALSYAPDLAQDTLERLFSQISLVEDPSGWDLLALALNKLPMLNLKPFWKILRDTLAQAPIRLLGLQPEAVKKNQLYLRAVLPLPAPGDVAKVLLQNDLRWKPQTILLPTLTEFLQESSSPPSELVLELRIASLKILDVLLACSTMPPSDMVRPTEGLLCPCADCNMFRAFLQDPKKDTWVFEAIQQRRQHVEYEAQNAYSDVDITTLRRGSPHKMVAKKNIGSHSLYLKNRPNYEKQFLLLQKM